MNIAKLLFITAILLQLGFYSKSYAQSHEKRANQEKPQFIFPAGCSYGIDCWAVNYVDVDPALGAAKDFKCNSKTYDGHKGVDFALGSVEQMRAGVDVFAAAAGKVLRIRDRENDLLKTSEEFDKIKQAKRECGNGVLIDHGNGLQSIYCHLKQNSVVVKPRQRVKAGQKIAQVGQSGVAEFPHLHFGVIWEGGVVDPYTGALNTEGCGQMKQSLWHIGLPMKYEEVAIFDGGFRAQPPDFTAIQKGDDVNPKTLSLSSAALVFWSGFYNVEAGDEVILKVTDPEGLEFITRHEIVKKTRARQYYFTGRKIGKVQLKKGIYKGYTIITRANGNIKREQEYSVIIE